MSGRTRLAVRVHPRAHTEHLEWDGSTLQLRVREPPADGRANAAVIRAVARWAGVGLAEALDSPGRTDTGNADDHSPSNLALQDRPSRQSVYSPVTPSAVWKASSASPGVS